MKERTKDIIILAILSVLLSLVIEIMQAQEQIGPYKVYINQETKLPSKVIYTIKKPIVKIPRKGNFKASEGSLPPKWYKGSGYDKGHLYAVIYCQNDKDMLNSFNMKNCLPQHPSLNRGEWKQLESYILALANEVDSIVVECGYVGIKDYYNLLPIPAYCYKDLFVWYKGCYKYESYLFPNGELKVQGFENYKLN
jgi:endonuclease G